MLLPNIILPFLAYTTIKRYFQKKKEKSHNLSSNYTASVHASSSIILWLLNKPYLFRYNSMGYFAYDILDIFINKKMKLLDYVYIYHHLASIYYMSLNPMIYNWFNIIAMGEIGNIPNYFVYHYLKTNPESYNLKTWKAIQKIVYGVVRIPIATYLTLNEISQPGHLKVVAPVTPLYFFGLVWAYVIINQ